MPVVPGAEPFHFPGADDGGVGVVLCHGFTGTTSSMRPWGEALAAAGIEVVGPRLPGHGTSWQEANKTRWPDWYGEVERSFDQLRQRCRAVFVMGLSMGGTLALRIAEERAGEVTGIVLVNPSLLTLRREAALLPVVSKVLRSFPPIAGDIKKQGVLETGYDRMPLAAMASLQQLWRVTRADLARITAPVLMFRSAEDHVVEPASGVALTSGATATTVTERILHNSYHVATLDNDASQIFAGSIDFVREVAGGLEQAGSAGPVADGPVADGPALP